MTMVVGMFKSLVCAQRAVSDLVASRYQRGAISVLVRQSRQEPLAAAVANCGTHDRRPWRVLAGGPLAVSLRDSEAAALLAEHRRGRADARRLRAHRSPRSGPAPYPDYYH